MNIKYKRIFIINNISEYKIVEKIWINKFLSVIKDKNMII